MPREEPAAYSHTATELLVVLCDKYKDPPSQPACLQTIWLVSMKRTELAAMPQVSSWFSPLLFLVTMAAMCIAATAVSSDMASAPRPNCQDKCGDVLIPYPFGIGNNCSWPGFDYIPIKCNDSFQPPRPYMGSMEIISITIETAEMRIYTPVSYVCFTSVNQSEGLKSWSFNFSSTPFLVSSTQNKFTALGCHTVAKLSGRDNGTYNTGCMTYCASVSEVKVDDGKCIGLGCCETSITNDLSYIDVYIANGTNKYNTAWEYSPCSYAFVAEKVWHDFNRQDVVGNMTFAKRNGGQGVPLVVDWAIRNNGTCHPGGGGDACVSAHSNCFNATNGPGYFCNCSKGYSGNPYVLGGCKNINECELRKNNPSIYEAQYPCHGGTCHDVEGDYKCKCNYGRRKNSKNDKDCQLILSKSAIAVIATICAISILAVLLLFFHMEREKRKLRDLFEKNGGQLIKKMGIKVFTKVEMDQITKNYSTILGKGGFGEVYMGTIDNQQVAVKRSITVDEARKKDFANEIAIQAQISHKNVVRLLGCCLETNIPMLVYEFIPKGSLYDVLHGNITNSGEVIKHPLSLQARLGIAIESAEALAYMHSSASQKILHGDVKSSNILLDDKFTPRVSDFGISRLLSIDKHHTRYVIGDTNYMDPVYMKTGLLTEKSDVYSFGVVLLELITGKKARYDGNKRLPLNFVKSYMTESRAREMFDEEIMSTEAIDCLEMIGRIAVQCLKGDVDERPTMKQVLENLHLVRKEWMQRQARANDLQSS